MKYDFGGYATKYNIRCADGRTIKPGAFSDCDGMEIPLVYQHVHSNPMNVLGHALLEHRDDGVYAYCSFNDTEPGRHMKKVVEHGDVKCLSIYANRLKQQGSDVIHGLINEVSVVLKGANPGAMIQNVSFAHADGFDYESEDDVIIHSGDPLEYETEEEDIEHSDDIEHADETDENQNGSSEDSGDKTIGDVIENMSEKKRAVFDFLVAASVDEDMGEAEAESDKEMEHADDENGETVQDIYDTFTEEEKTALNYVIGKMKEDVDEDVDEEDEEIEHSDEGEDSFMYKNVFDQTDTHEAPFELTHSDMEKIVESAKHGNGSLKDAICHYVGETFEIPEGTTDAEILAHSVESIDILFPEAKLGSANPELISRPMDWVGEVWNATKKSPFARVKSIAADITADEARARGYQKGKKKIEEVVKLLKRKTTPQTVYKLQKLDRDDVIDATELDVVAWLKQEMRMMLNEELSRAILIGDGREEQDESKIYEDNIRPVYTDDDLYTIKKDVTINSSMDRLEKSDAIVDAAIEARADYMGSGSPVMYASTTTINMMLLARDKVGHRLYKTVTELADACRVSKIVEVPIFDNATREEGSKSLLALIVNLNDYTVGADRGGEINLFDDFDINYNKYEYLIETRCSGALTKPYSAIALETDTTNLQTLSVPGVEIRS